METCEALLFEGKEFAGQHIMQIKYRYILFNFKLGSNDSAREKSIVIGLFLRFRWCPFLALMYPRHDTGLARP